MWMYLCSTFLIHDWCEGASLRCAVHPLGRLLLGCIRKSAEPVCSIFTRSLFHFLLQAPSLSSCLSFCWQWNGNCIKLVWFSVVSQPQRTQPRPVLYQETSAHTLSPHYKLMRQSPLTSLQWEQENMAFRLVQIACSLSYLWSWTTLLRTSEEMKA